MFKYLTKFMLAVMAFGVLMNTNVSLAATHKAERVEQAKSVDSSPTKVVNINTADATGLATLKGIGPKKAAAIIEYREKSGGFNSLDDLAKVKGIGEKRLAKIKADNPDRIAIK